MKIKTKQLQNNWKVFTLTNINGVTVEVLNFGGILTKILTPDKEGRVGNIVLGYKNMLDYQHDPNYFGALIGRVAGRIQNAEFVLDGKTYRLKANEGPNHLHGGNTGLHKVIWNADPFEEEDKLGLKLSYFSKDGENGYPGNVNITVTYTLTNEDELIINYSATTDKTTVLTLTNHTYFNLSGDLKETIHQHHVTMDSSRFAQLDARLLPTGDILDVTNSTFDFRSGRALASGIHSTMDQHNIVGNGYDHYFIFDQKKPYAVVATEPVSGRVLKMKTTQPGMVMYTSNNLGSNALLNEGMSKNYLGVCFETQSSPASLHHDGLPSILLNADESYQEQTVFKFGTLMN